MAPSRGRPRPPKVAAWLLEMLLDPTHRDFFLGDLQERYAELASQRSWTRAWLWYWRQTIQALFTFGWEVFAEGRTTGLGRDVRGAVRNLVRDPLPTAGMVLILAFGVGAVGTAFSVLHGTVLRGLPFFEAHRLVHFERANPVEGHLAMAVTPHDFRDWRDGQRSFEDLGAYVEAVGLLPNDGAPPTRRDGVFISPNSFSLLRVAPALGRPFTPDDALATAPDVVILSHGLWRSRFGRDPGLVGRDILLNGLATTVVGIMPEGFGFPIAEDFWLPLRLDFSRIQRGQGRLDVFGRLRPGVRLERAVEEFHRIALALEEAYPEANANVRPVLKSFQAEYVGDEFGETVWKMFAGALLVLVICCANLTNLLLIRGIGRRRDLAVRAAFGAGRASMVRLMLAEGALLALGGSAVGIVLVHFGVGWFNTAGAQAGVFDLPHGPTSLFWWQVRPDPLTLLAVVAVAGGTAVVATLLPALSVTGDGAAITLREEGKTGPNRRSGRIASGLVVAQVALTTGLSVAGAFVVQSGWNARRSNGLLPAPEEVLTARLDLPVASAGSLSTAYPDAESRIRFAELLVGALEAVPEVEVAAVATSLPLLRPLLVPVTVEGLPVAGDPPRVGAVTVSHGYFQALGVGLLEGRPLGEGTVGGGEPRVLVNQTFAARFFAGRSAVGGRIRLGLPEEGDIWYRVVGVVPDLWDSDADPSREAGVYLPLSRSAMGVPEVRLGWQQLRFQSVLVRARPGMRVDASTLRTVTYRLDSSIPLNRIRTMADVSATQVGRYRVWGRFYLAFALAGLLLAGVGVYGVLASEVSGRASELSIRRALGASEASVRRQILGSSLRQVGTGALLGVALGWAVAHGLTGLLYGIDASEPVVYLIALVLVGGVGFLGSWAPAVLATRMDPLDALRR